MLPPALASLCARMTAHIAQSRAQVRQMTAARLRAARG